MNIFGNLRSFLPFTSSRDGGPEPVRL